MKPTITLLIALLLIGVVGLLFPVLAIVCMIALAFYGIVQLALICKELNRNEFGKKNEL